MKVYKYDANGNDFIIFHTLEEKDYRKLAIELCNRKSSIGADGLIVILQGNYDGYHFRWLFYNSDGSVASMCGNGSRACAHYAFYNNIAPCCMKFMTGAGIISCSVDGDVVETELTSPVEIGAGFEEKGFFWRMIDTGVPHLVTLVDAISNFEVDLCREMRWKHNANVNFVSVKNNDIVVRTYERGVEGETLACGTGMAACFYFLFRDSLVENEVFITPKSREYIQMKMNNGKISLKAPVKLEFSIDINVE